MEAGRPAKSQLCWPRPGLPLACSTEPTGKRESPGQIGIYFGGRTDKDFDKIWERKTMEASRMTFGSLV